MIKLRSRFAAGILILGSVTAVTQPAAARCSVNELRDDFDQLRLQNVEEVRLETHTSEVLPQLSTEGGELVGYFEAEKLVVVKLAVYGEMGRAEETYHLHDASSHMFRRMTFNYRQHLSMGSSGALASVELDTAYVCDGKLLKQTGEVVSSISEHMKLLGLFKVALNRKRESGADSK